MPGWSLVDQSADGALWRDEAGDVISLTRMRAGFGPLGLSTNQVRGYARDVAEQASAGLVDVRMVEGPTGECVSYVYKKLRMPAFTFYGVAVVPRPDESWVWMIIAGERGTTGVREAVITERLVTAGEITVETYGARWTSDPFDPSYDGVDRRTLRYLSDDEKYDAEFPHHPLSKVRRELQRLMQVEV